MYVNIIAIDTKKINLPVPTMKPLMKRLIGDATLYANSGISSLQYLMLKNMANSNDNNNSDPVLLLNLSMSPNSVEFRVVECI